MKKFMAIGLVMIVAGVALVAASGHEKLIELDKKWGQANITGDKATLEMIYADDAVAISPEGRAGKAQIVEASQASDDADAKYEPTDFEVIMLGDDVAVMTHKAANHWSLHVWANRDGKWQVVGTASSEIESGETTDR